MNGPAQSGGRGMSGEGAAQTNQDTQAFITKLNRAAGVCQHYESAY